MHTTFKIRCRAIIMHEGKVLLVRHDNGNNFYSFPGGHLDFGEDPKECMKREIIEELGILPVLGRLLYVHTFIDNEGKQSVEFFFEVTNGVDFVSHEEGEKSHAFEIAETVWVSPVEDINVRPEMIGEDFKKGELFHEETRYVKGDARQFSQKRI